MSCKVDAIMKVLKAKGFVSLDMDRSSGLPSVSVGSRGDDWNAISLHGVGLRGAFDCEVRDFLESHRMFINGWK